MPNTLAHIAVQVVASRAVVPAADPKWLLLGVVLPDLPWIGERLARSLGASGYEPRLYFAVQASLLLCLILSAALALLSQRPRLVFALLATNSVIHLLLDASECKWGNGVHLLAPWSWVPLNFGPVWPEHPLVLAITAAGLGLLVRLIRRPGEPIGLTFGRGRVLAAAALLAAYALWPLPLRHAMEAADAYSVASLRHPVPGQTVAFDRAEVWRDGAATWLRTIGGDVFPLRSAAALPEGTLSLRGRFAADGAIEATELHVHRPWLRDGPTYVGLAAFAAVWLAALWGRRWFGREMRHDQA